MFDITMLMTVLAPIGGIESALVPLARELQAQGHRVRIYVVRRPTLPNQHVASLTAAGIPILSAPPWLVRLTDLVRGRRLALIAAGLTLLSPLLALLALADALRRGRAWQRSWQGAQGVGRERLARLTAVEHWYYRPLQSAWRRSPPAAPAIVHVHGWGCGEDPLGALAWLRGFAYPVVYTEHNSPDPALHEPLVAAPLLNADLLIAVSAAGRDGLIGIGGAVQPIAVIPYPVTPLPARPSTASGPCTIICVARLMPQKGHRDLLHAVAQVSAAGVQVRLLLAGDGPLAGELQTLTAQLHLASQVRFLGIVTHADLPDLLAVSDAVVLPSYWEGLPVALIEALAAGKPIVATRVGGNPELVVDGENGWLVAPGDVPALAAALTDLAQRPRHELHALGEASRRRFQAGGFEPAAVAARTVAAYHLAQQASRSRTNA